MSKCDSTKKSLKEKKKETLLRILEYASGPRRGAETKETKEGEDRWRKRQEEIGSRAYIP